MSPPVERSSNRYVAVVHPLNPRMSKKSALLLTALIWVVRMLVAVALVFAICWLPYHVYFIYAYHHPKILKTDYIQHVYLAFYWLAMSNSTYNPIVYYCMNNRFKRYFRKVLCCCRKTTENVACPGRSSVEGSATRLRSFTRRTLLRKSTLSKANQVNKMNTNDLIDDV
ncbi:neuromedin-K receptor-like [Limulus polyphemus]|uniref:Neuromedin-K receptor-like n=1 Tax=Limulus polyphemus TaxID=6850 RepID=A0ABM1SQ07_LIMPO|nr:neuromedin-K receptor-like [Limulus polyphemus]